MATTSRPAASSTDADSPGVERLYTAGVVEVRSGSGGRTVGGYASTFGTRSRLMSFGYEMVDRGFFNESRRQGFPNVVARWDHRPTLLLGSTDAGTLRLDVDSTGLNFDVDLPECRADLYELVQRRDVAQASFAFADAQDRWSYADGHPLRTLLSGRLIDVAPVSAGEVAAYPTPSVALRSLAAHVGAPFEDVAALAEKDELRQTVAT